MLSLVSSYLAGVVLFYDNPKILGVSSRVYLLVFRTTKHEFYEGCSKNFFLTIRFFSITCYHGYCS